MTGASAFNRLAGGAIGPRRVSSAGLVWPFCLHRTGVRRCVWQRSSPAVLALRLHVGSEAQTRLSARPGHLSAW
jgi:hypothetical protein